MTYLTANLQSCILCIYLTKVGTEYFKHCVYSAFFPLQNAVCFIILTYLVPVLFTFYIQSVLKFKKNHSVAKRLNSVQCSWIEWTKIKNKELLFSGVPFLGKFLYHLLLNHLQYANLTLHLLHCKLHRSNIFPHLSKHRIITNKNKTMRVTQQITVSIKWP